MTDKASYIRKRFPDQKHRIDLLMAQNSEFTDICEDLADCVNALQYWTKSKEPEAESRIVEYRILIEQLEEEIIQALDSVNPS
jgi:hypothetical protein